MTIDPSIPSTYHNIILLFDNAKKGNQEYFENHSIQILEDDSREFMIETLDASTSCANAELVSRVSPVNNFEEDVLSKIEALLSRVFRGDSLTVHEKFDICEKAKELFISHGKTLNCKDDSVIVSLVEANGNTHSIKLSLDQISSCAFFKNLLCENFAEGISVSQKKEIQIILPSPITHKDFHKLMHFNELTSFEEMLAPMYIASYFMMHDLLSNCVEHAKNVLTSEDLFLLITEFPYLQRPSDISILVSGFIRTSLFENISIDEIIEKMSEPEFQEKIRDVPISLNLSNLNLLNTLLIDLDIVIPNIY